MSNASVCHLIACEPIDNRSWLIDIFAAQRAGHGCLPHRLGLDLQSYRALLDRYFAGQQAQLDDTSELQQDRSLLREELLQMRRDEWQNLRLLLLADRFSSDCEQDWMASIVAAGCLGGSHLWRDLGLASRQALRELLFYNFPTLVLRNHKDMRWKKFFYRQLCENGGGQLCLAPSCEVCTTYAECFGEEL